MPDPRGVSPLAIDLTRLHRRTVTSFYSNLVTRPTGRAVRMGVESQLAELERSREICLSVLDFSQVNVLDYSCADEIVAKLLLRYLAESRPAAAYFIVRGLQDHQRDAVEAVLERHNLLVVAQQEDGEFHLLGPSNPMERACWAALLQLGGASAALVASRAGVGEEAADATLARLVAQRVALALPDGRVCALSYLLSMEP